MSTTMLPAAGYAKRMATQVSVDQRVEKLCEAIGYGPGDVELARYVAGLEARIAELEKKVGTKND